MAAAETDQQDRNSVWSTARKFMNSAPSDRFNLILAVVSLPIIIAVVVFLFPWSDLNESLGDPAGEVAEFAYWQLLLLPAGLLYAFPGYVAHYKKHPAATKLSTINLLTGWTIIGWFICLLWAAHPPEPATIKTSSPE